MPSHVYYQSSELQGELMEISLKKSEKFKTLSVILYPIFYSIFTIKIHQNLFSYGRYFYSDENIYDTGSLRIGYFGGQKPSYFLIYLFGQQVGNCISYGHT